MIRTIDPSEINVELAIQREFEETEVRHLTFASYIDFLTLYLIENGELPQEAQ